MNHLTKEDQNIRTEGQMTLTKEEIEAVQYCIQVTRNHEDKSQSIYYTLGRLCAKLNHMINVLREENLSPIKEQILTEPRNTAIIQVAPNQEELKNTLNEINRTLNTLNTLINTLMEDLK